jgi:DNA-directed RNA polymerase, mitochondrial
MRDDLTDGEVKNEQLMGSLGVDRYRSKYNSALERGSLTSTSPGQRVLRESVSILTEAIEQWIHSEKQRNLQKHRAQHKLVKVFEEFPIELIAHLSIKIVLDKLMEPRGRSTVVNWIGKRLEDEARFNSLAKQNPLWMEKLLQKTKNSGYTHLRRTSVAYAIASKTKFSPWPMQIKLAVGMILYQLIKDHTGVISEQTYKKLSPKGYYFTVVQVTPSPEILAWFEDYNEAHESLSPFWMPMLVPPGDWTDVYGGGYRLEEFKKPLIKTRFLDEIHAEGVGSPLETVNILQRVPWQVCPNAWETISYFWEMGGGRGCMPEREDLDLPDKPVDMDTCKVARREWCIKAHEIYSKRGSHRSRRLLAIKTIEMAREFRNKTFYFPYQLDFRGRIYPVPYFLQPQGPSLSRGLLEFARKHHMTRGGDAEKWLQIHGANTWGYDKVTLEARQQWVRDHEREIVQVYEDPISSRWWEDADSPHQFLQFCLEYGELVEKGCLDTALPVMIDGSNNGLQIFSLLSRNIAGAIGTNVSDNSTPQDLYQIVADAVTEKLKKSDNKYAAKWLAICGGRISRGVTKRPVMTLPYGVTLFSVQKYIREWLVEEHDANVFGTDGIYKPCSFLASEVWSAIGEKVGFATACMQWLKQCSKILSKQGLAIRWTSPSGFPVIQSQFKEKRRRVKTRVGETVRLSSYTSFDFTKLDATKQRNGISPNFVHSLDAACLARAVNKASEEGIRDLAVIHDSFGCPAPQMERMRGIVREVYHEIFSANILEELAEEFRIYSVEKIPEPPVMGNFNIDKVLKSDYLFS